MSLMVIMYDEKSESRTKKHAVRKIPFIVTKDGKVEVVRSGKRIEVKPTYVKGYAYRINVKQPEKAVLVQVNMVKCLRDKVKGEILVYDGNETPVFRAVYRKLKIRRVFGDPKYGEYVKIICRYLKIPVKRYNLGEEKRVKI